MGQPDPTKFLAGGRAFDFPAQVDGGLGHVYAANLTPDQTSGLGSWTASNIVDALTVGVDKDGLPLFPIMPYYMFGNLSDDDAMSIALYLQSIPAISNVVPKNNVQVPQASTRIDDTQIPHTALPSTDPGFASAERGRYLVKVSCIECHTKHNAPGAASVIDLAKAFAGGETFQIGPNKIPSANLTPHATGLGGWTPAEIAATLKTDQERGVGRMLCPPMPGGTGRLGGLTDPDLNDIANFLHTLAPIQNGPFGCTDAGIPYGVPDGG